MNNEEIIEGNLLIAKFRDCKVIGEYVKRTTKDWDFPGTDSGMTFKIEYLKYHTSYNWLMPVVEKINSMNSYSVTIFKATVHVNDEYGVLIVTSGKLIEALWSAVVQFIRYHNSMPAL